MDEADRAEHQEELARQAAISRRKPVPKHDGRCLNCRKESEGAYCDDECGVDHRKREAGRERAGL
jgi:hypothetical protein